MSTRTLSLAFAAAAFAFVASPANAGGPYGPGAYDPYCRCYAPVVRPYRAYGYPVTYYAPREVYVRKRVYVKKRVYVHTPMYFVDQGPSFYMPPVPYTLPRVYYAKKRPYPYGSSNAPRVHRHHAYRGHRYSHRHHAHPRMHGRAASRAGK